MKVVLVLLSLTTGVAFAGQPMAPCSAGPMFCTQNYAPVTCEVQDATTGEFVTSVSGSNGCMAQETFRGRQCAARRRNPRLPDASAYALENCVSN